MKFEQFPNNVPKEEIPTQAAEFIEQKNVEYKNRESGLENPSFEQADRVLQEMEQEAKTGKSERVLSKIKKYVALAVVGLAPLLVTGCGEKSHEDGKQKGSITQSVEGARSAPSGRLSEQFRKERDVRREITRMILENEKQIMSGSFDLSTNNFLKYYKDRLGQSVPSEHMAVMDEGAQMRMLEIAQKKGLDIHKASTKRLSRSLDVGGVPLIFEIDGKKIEVGNEDLTDQELQTLQGRYQFFQNDPEISPDDTPEMKKDKEEIIKNHQEVRKIFERLGLSETNIEINKITPTNQPQGSKGGIRGSREVPIPDGKIRQGPDFDKDADF